MGDRFKIELIIAGIYETILSAPMVFDWHYRVEGMDNTIDQDIILYIEEIITERGWNISHYTSTWNEDSDNQCYPRKGVIFRVRPK